jgi:hypothetical protein
MNLLSQLSFNEGFSLIKPLLLLIFGIAIYSFFVFKFYRFMAKKDVFGFNLFRIARKGHYKVKVVLKAILYFIEYILFVPFFAFFWLVFISLIMLFMAPQQTATTVLLLSVGLIGVTRIAAYYSEDLSRDLAKTLPFSLLVLFLIDIENFSMASVLQVGNELSLLWKPMIYYLLVIILIEIILRLLTLSKNLFRILRSYN